MKTGVLWVNILHMEQKIWFILCMDLLMPSDEFCCWGFSRKEQESSLQKEQVYIFGKR